MLLFLVASREEVCLEDRVTNSFSEEIVTNAHNNRMTVYCASLIDIDKNLIIEIKKGIFSNEVVASNMTITFYEVVTKEEVNLTSVHESHKKEENRFVRSVLLI